MKLKELKAVLDSIKENDLTVHLKCEKESLYTFQRRLF
jgi:hypothetical protein